MFKLDPQLKSAWDDVLFWSRRLSYRSADNHPEWREAYVKAQRHLEEVKESLNRKRHAE